MSANKVVNNVHNPAIVGTKLYCVSKILVHEVSQSQVSMHQCGKEQIQGDHGEQQMENTHK